MIFNLILLNNFNFINILIIYLNRVSDCSGNPFLVRLFGEVKKIAAESTTAFSVGTSTKKAGSPKILFELTLNFLTFNFST